MPGARKERILVTETKIDELLPIAYRSRFVEYLSFEDGSIVNKDPAIVIPANLKKIIEIRNEEISSSFYLYKGISIQALTELALVSSKIYGAYKSINGTGHNQSILGSLIEYNPQHAFVTLDNFTLQGIFGKKTLCSHSPSLFFEQANRIKTDLTKIIADYNIGYINFSSGYTSRLIAEEFKSTCGQDIGYSTAHYLEMAMELFFESMGSDDHTILVQSAAYKGNVGNIDKKELRYPSRIRVGAINMMYSDLDQDGVSEKVSNFENLLSRYDGMGVYADVYVNLAIDLYFDTSPSTFMTTGLFGLGIFQTTNMHSTSIAAPLGLSRIITIKDTSFPSEDLNPEIIKKIKDFLTPEKCPYLTNQKCIFQDPSKHKNLMIYKLGYR
jgi:hypothetical protein